MGGRFYSPLNVIYELQATNKITGSGSEQLEDGD
jgi:hypothetical protein